MRIASSFLFVLVLLNLLHAEFGQSATIFQSDEPPSAKLNLTNLTLSQDPLYAGGSTDFIVAMLSWGSLSANVTLNVTIYNSTEDPVDSVVFDSVIVPPMTTFLVSKTWSSAGFAIGIYHANVTGVYNDGANATNSVSRIFSILPAPIITPTPQPPGSQGGTGSSTPISPGEGSPPVPTAIPPIKPVVTKLKFLKTTLLKETVAGDSIFESFLIKNIGSTELKTQFRITGIPQAWLSYSPQESILLLGEERVVNLGINVPSDALSGDYLMKLEGMENNESAIDYMVLRVKPFNRDSKFPIALKTIRLDKSRAATSVSIDVRNPSNEALPSINVIEELLPNFRITKDDIDFQDKPAYDIFEGNPLKVKWRITQLAPGEIVRISYTLHALLSEYRPYVYWSVKQVELATKEITISDLVTIKEITASPAQEGGESTVTAKIFYAGFDMVTFKGVLELPPEFETQPLEIEQQLVPRGYTIVTFRIKTPKKSIGTHSFVMSLDLGGGNMVQSTGYLTIGQPVSLSLQMIILVALAVIAVVLSILHFIGRRKMIYDKRAQAELRQGYIKQIKDHLK